MAKCAAHMWRALTCVFVQLMQELPTEVLAAIAKAIK